MQKRLWNQKGSWKKNMDIKEYRAQVFMEMMSAPCHSALERSKLEELRDIDRVIFHSQQYHEKLLATKYGYIKRSYF